MKILDLDERLAKDYRSNLRDLVRFACVLSANRFAALTAFAEGCVEFDRRDTRNQKQAAARRQKRSKRGAR